MAQLSIYEVLRDMKRHGASLLAMQCMVNEAMRRSDDVDERKCAAIIIAEVSRVREGSAQE